MKVFNWFKLIAINALLVLVIILPFLPGPPNGFVIALSTAGQLAGFFGLPLVPIGITWTILEIIKVQNGSKSKPDSRPAYILGMTASIFVCVIYFLLAIAMFFYVGWISGSLCLLLGVLALKPLIVQLRKMKSTVAVSLRPVPLYLFTIPLVALLTRLYIMDPLSDYSRNFAIERSQVLIASIEDFRAKQGVYPASLEELEAGYLKEIPSPSIMGIPKFRYNRINDQYSLSFSQWLDLGSLEEIVLYDKNNLRNNLVGKYAKYDYDLDLWRVKGAFASYDAGHGDWRYYHLD